MIPHTRAHGATTTRQAGSGTATPDDFEALDPVLLVTRTGGDSIVYSPGGPEYHLHRGALDKHGIEGSGYSSPTNGRSMPPCPPQPRERIIRRVDAG